MTVDSLFELALLPIVAYLISLPFYWVLHKLLRKFTQLEIGFWKLSFIAFLAVIPSELLGILAVGGDGSPPATSISFLYTLIGAGAFTVIYWLGARLFKVNLSPKATIISFVYVLFLSLLVVFTSLSGS